VKRSTGEERAKSALQPKISLVKKKVVRVKRWKGGGRGGKKVEK